METSRNTRKFSEEEQRENNPGTLHSSTCDSLAPEARPGASAPPLPAHPRCPAPAAPTTPCPGSNPTQAVLPEGNARCSGKSAPKPQPAHILAVGSHQSLFTGAIFSLKESCALGCSVLSLCRVPLICMTRSSSWGSDPEGSWEASNWDLEPRAI